MGGAGRQLLVLAAVVIALAAVTAIVWAGDGNGSPPEAAPTPAPAPRQAAGLDGAAVFQAKGCATCHMAPGAEEGFRIGPDLRSLPAVAGSRVAGRSAEEYVRESVLDPGAFAAPAPARGGPYGPMPRLAVSPAELDALVLYLLRT